MIYLVNYNKKSQIQHSDRKSKGLIFIEAGGCLALDKIIALLRELTVNDLEESSVQIIGQKNWDAAKIKTPGIRFHKLD
jgi:hypothetical protein